MKREKKTAEDSVAIKKVVVKHPKGTQVKYKKYTLEPDGNRFNLFKSVTKTKKSTGRDYDHMEVMGYGMRFETCVDHIVCDCINVKNTTYSLREYIDEYKQIKSEVLLEMVN